MNEELKSELIESLLDKVTSAIDVNNFTRAGHLLRQGINLAIHSGWTLEGLDALPDSILPGHDFGTPCPNPKPITAEERQRFLGDLVEMMGEDAALADEATVEEILKDGREHPLPDDQSRKLLTTIVHRLNEGAVARGQTNNLPKTPEGIAAYVEEMVQKRKVQVGAETDAKNGC